MFMHAYFVFFLFFTLSCALNNVECRKIRTVADLWPRWGISQYGSNQHLPEINLSCVVFFLNSIILYLYLAEVLHNRMCIINKQGAKRNEWVYPFSFLFAQTDVSSSFQSCTDLFQAYNFPRLKKNFLCKLYRLHQHFKKKNYALMRTTNKNY